MNNTGVCISLVSIYRSWIY